MSSPNVVNIIRVPGRLIANPANLTTPPNYGGTMLGIHRDLEIHFEAKHYFVKAEEWGQCPVELVYCGQAAHLKGFARGVDKDALAALWPYSTPGGGGDTVISDTPVGNTGNTRAGTLMSTFALKLLFAPLDNTNHPFVVLYKAVPTIPENAFFPLTRSEEIAFPFAFRAIPDSSGRAYAIGKATSISL